MDSLLSSRVGRQLTARPASGTWLGSALVLHGGRTEGTAPVTGRQLAVLRIEALSRSLHRRIGRQGVAVYFLHFSVRGWNGAEASPVPDTTWALGEIERLSEGRPVVLVGHSMGGRTAVYAAGHASVRGVVGLAPWLEPGDPIEPLAGRRLLIGHGTADRVTDPAGSARFVERSRAVTTSSEFVPIPGEAHALLRKAGTWNALAERGVHEGLGLR